MKVLVYTRPRIDVFFKELVKVIPVFSSVSYFSDHSGTENIDVMSKYYFVKSKYKKNEINNHPIWNEIDFNSVSRRCRYLRTLPHDEKIDRIKCMSIALCNIIEEHDPDYIFGMVMDSYVLDLCDRIMRLKGRQYIGFLNNMLNGYSRLTSRGELIFNEEPSDILVQEKIDELKGKYYIPNMQKDFMWNTTPPSMFFTKYLKEKLKILFYAVKRTSDPDNFYYNTVASKDCMSCRRISQIFFRRFENKNYQSLVGKAKSLNKKIVYLPLQFYPECSIDYWGTSSDFSDFYKTVSNLLSVNFENILILVKEHPSAYGLRKSSFYKNFSENQSFCLVPFDTPSNEVIEHADLVLTWTGSVGIEAIIRNKPLITFGAAYYAVGAACKELSDYQNLKELETIIVDSIDDFESGEVLARDVLKYILSGLVEGYVFPLDYGTAKNPFNKNNMKVLGRNISLLIEKIQEQGAYEIRPGTYD